MTDLQIAQSVRLRPIQAIAQTAGIPEEALSLYGRNIAKVDIARLPASGAGKLVLVTAINPTPAGEGKTTVSIGLADGLRRNGKRAMLALREPSLGPVFGMKGGAAGGGWAQVLPMEEINLHFTGDLHAITSANNLLAALVDNHIQQGNALDIDARAVSWRRCMDMNDRQLRHIVSGIGGKGNGTPREDGFDITAASEVMAVLCLAADAEDLKARLERLVVAQTRAGKPVTAGQLKAEGAMAVLLKQALWPNLVQTIEGTPALLHGGPFANIAHGCNSVLATKTALRLSEYTVTEAGFGADLGAEKFLDIKCRMAGLQPDAVVVVATLRALKHHGGCPKEEYARDNEAYLRKGLPNLEKHIENLRGVYGLPVVVALNRFASDSDAELAIVRDACAALGVEAIPSDVWGKGGEGGQALAEAVARLCEEKSILRHPYALEEKYEAKIEAVARKIYGAGGVEWMPGVRATLARIEKQGYAGLPVCIAKTQYSLSDDPKRSGRPEGFVLTVRDARLSAGAGFVVVFAGEIIAMTGLPMTPAAENIDINTQGLVTGLF